MKRKRPFTLIEVLVSLGLFSVLLSSLLFCYSLFSKNKYHMQTLKAEIYEKRYALLRVETLLRKAKLPFFSDKDNNVVFLFERGVFEDPLLSGVVLGHLFFDKAHKALCLSVWPYPTTENPLKEPNQTFVLLENIEKLEFQFYFPPLVEDTSVAPEKVGDIRPKTGWQLTWNKEFAELPALFKIILKQHGEETFVYRIDLQQSVIYPKEKIET